MVISDKELSKLNHRRQELIRDFDKKEISEEQYNERIKKLDIEINEKLRVLIDNNKIEEEAKQKMEEQQAPVQAEDKPKVKGRKVRGDSYASAISKVLQMKSVNSVDEAVAKIDEIKPGREKKKNVTQIKTVIRLAKAGKGRWAAFEWNDEQFLLVPKEQA